jgi:hypothetical protein
MPVFFLIHNLVWYITAQGYLTCFSRPRVGNLTRKNYKSKMPGVCPAPPGWWKQMIGALGTRFKFKIYRLWTLFTLRLVTSWILCEGRGLKWNFCKGKISNFERTTLLESKIVVLSAVVQFSAELSVLLS